MNYIHPKILITNNKNIVLKYSVVVLIIGVFLSCGKKNQSEIPFFDQEIKYQEAPVLYSETYPDIYQPRKMRVVDNLLLISDAKNAPPIHVYKINEDGSLKYLKGEGEEGRGPGEFQVVNDFIETDSLIYVYDGGQLKMVPFDKMINPVSKEDILMKIQGRPVSMNALSGGRFAAGGLFFNDRFQVFNDDGDLVGKYGKQINYDQDFTAHNLATSWYSYSVTDPTGEFVYLFALNADFIEKYDANGTLLKRIQGDEFPLPKMKLEVTDDRPWPVDDGGRAAYLWVDSNDEHIYALYIGEKFEEIEQLQTDKIHVFDWNLNLVGAFKLAHKPNMIAADDHGGLYSFLTIEEGTQVNYQKLKLN